MRVIITTFNVLYKNYEVVEGYSEVHEINRISNIKHLIATIESVVTNNITYKNDKTVLNAIIVSCDDDKVCDVLIKYYDAFQIPNVSVTIDYLHE